MLLQHGKFLYGNVYLPNLTPVLILRPYMLFGLVLTEMEVGIRFLEIMQTEFEPASQGHNQGDCLLDMPSLFNNNICVVLEFENSSVHIEFQGARLRCRATRVIPDKHECLHFAQLHEAWDTTVTFSNVAGHLHDTNFLQFSPCSYVMRQCIFMTSQLHLSQIECETMVLNAAWQLQTTMRCQLLGRRQIAILLSGHPVTALSCRASEPCLSLTLSGAK